ncbi:MAG TPA: hypothetical protein EYQ27_16710 [Gemmatimonadetes bacterium]|nr:hypothetical protein [Gemmatimonadota bacterium]
MVDYGGRDRWAHDRSRWPGAGDPDSAGDSFYEGPIWLFAPETDLDQYEASVARMAALVPDLTQLFPAHNTPAVDPSRLIELQEAFAGVRDGTLQGTPEGDDGDMVRYEAGAFSLLLRAGG